MRDLLYVIHFTGEFDEMRKFYARGLDLPVRREEPGWVEFDTAGASIALHRMDDPDRQGTLLRFGTDDLESALRELKERDLEPWGDIIEFRGSRIASFWDPDRNLIQLIQLAHQPAVGRGPEIDTLILNVADTIASTTFYRDQFGIEVLLQSPWWTELETGKTRVALHPRVAPTDELRHNAQRVVVGFDVPSLEEVGRELAGRGIVYTGGPVEQRYGRFAEVTDPDGNVVLFRRSDPREPLEGPESPEEQLAEPYEDDAPMRSAMHKPAKKRGTATSRLAVKPEYKVKKRAAKPKRAKPAPERSGAKRAKVKPATGRLKKAERRNASRKKTSVARASRSKPVKRKAAKRGRPRGR